MDDLSLSLMPALSAANASPISWYLVPKAER
jgi:hypothetical protein